MARYFCYLYLLHFGWHLLYVHILFHICTHTRESISCYVFTHNCIYWKSNLTLHIHGKGKKKFHYSFIFWKQFHAMHSHFEGHFCAICTLAKPLATYPTCMLCSTSVCLLLPTLYTHIHGKQTLSHNLGAKKSSWCNPHQMLSFSCTLALKNASLGS